MKKLVSSALVALALVASVGCSYAGVAAGSNGKIYVARNDSFLYGMLRQIYECEPNAGGGEMACSPAGAP